MYLLYVIFKNKYADQIIYISILLDK